MQTVQDVSIQKAIPFLQANDVEFAGVFGSFARGAGDFANDIDILVRFSKPKSLFEMVRLERLLSEKLEKKIDLVTEDSISPYMKENVFNDLKILYGQG